MARIVSRDEILEGYPKLDNNDELFDSDVLILPMSKEDVTTFNELSFFLALDLKDINVKFYGELKSTMKYNQVSPILEYGSCIVSTIAGLIVIYNFIKKCNEDINIHINLNIKVENNIFLNIPYEGNGSDINIDKEIVKINNEIMEIKSQLKK